jgi:serine/threonine protein kinase
MTTRLQHFAKQLEESGVLDAETLRDFLPPKAQPKDSHELARELIRHKKLTRFQAEEAYRGKAQSLVLGNYILLDKIGAGGMGQVFRARHRLLDRVVAVKLLPSGMMQDKSVIERFEREVRAAGKLNHPNIVRAENADQANGVHFLVMEYVDGGDLSKRVKKNGPLALPLALDCVLQAARGLAYAHGVGVVHRDIKPANLLLDTKGVVKILDMGLARMTGEGGVSSNPELTSTGTIMGTAQYMAPEQALDTRAADHRADVYSLGCTLYFLVAGRAMYQGESVMRTIFAHREQPIPPIRDVRPEASLEFDAIFHRMVAKDVESRYQTMAELIADLETCTPLLSDEQATGSTRASRIAAAAVGAASAAIPAGRANSTAKNAVAAAGVPVAAGDTPAASSSSQVADFLADLGSTAQRKRGGAGKASSKGTTASTGGRATSTRSASGPSLAERLAAIPPMWWLVGGSGAMLLVLIAVLLGLVIVFLGSPSGEEAPQSAQATSPVPAPPVGVPSAAKKPVVKPLQASSGGTGQPATPLPATPLPATPLPATPLPMLQGATQPLISDPTLPIRPQPSTGPAGVVPPAMGGNPNSKLADAIAASAKAGGEPSILDKPFPKIDFQFPGAGGGVKPGEWRSLLVDDALPEWKQLERDKVQDGVLRIDTPSGIIQAPGYYKHFELELEFRLADAGDSGLGILYSGNGNPAQQGIEVQLVDDDRNMQKQETGRCASLYDLIASEGAEFRRWPAWNRIKASVTREEIVVDLNGVKVVAANREQLRVQFPRHAGVLNDGGHLCLYPIRGEQEYRNFRVREFR